MSRPVFLIADANGTRRNALMQKHCGTATFALVASSTLGNTYQLLERHLPAKILVAAEMAELPDFLPLIEMIELIGTELTVFGTSRRPLAERVVAIARQSVNISALLSELSGTNSAPAAPLDLTAKPLLPRSASRAGPISAGDMIICIGASTGGVSALEAVLSSFPSDCPPTLIVQHMRAGFIKSLVRRFDRALAPRVVSAESGQVLEQGTIYLAASTDQHMGLTPFPRVQLTCGPTVSGHRPSVDVLFTQAAALADRFTVCAALLTGMGADGAEGMCTLRKAGARTIAQDRDSSVVWGMPRVAIERGGALAILGLSEIGAALLQREGPETRRIA